MELLLSQGDFAAVETPALALLLGAEVEALTGVAAEVDRACGGVLAAFIKQGDFHGKPGEVRVLYTLDGKVQRLIVSALGKASKMTLEQVRDAAGRAAVTARELNVGSLCIALPDHLPFDANDEEVARAVVEGALLAQYQFHSYRTQDLDEVKVLDKITLVAGSQADAASLNRGMKTAQALASVIGTARDWILHPGAHFTPLVFANEAQKEAEALGLKVTVLDQAALKDQGFRTLLAVAQGSVNEPRLIRIDYRGGGDEPPIAVVGKGITFDTGGLQIKPGAGMEKMKYDMAGGAAAIAIVLACARMELKRNVSAVVVAAENMPSATATRPGDVVKSYSGLTIEINDTDAEGRLVLADALGYVVKEIKPQSIIDMATLTGSVAVALGRLVMGVMGNEQALVERFIKVADRAGERAWQLPLFEHYEEAIASDIADMKNYGGRYGDTVNAATMLKHFVGDTPWLHLDIAGVGWSDTERGYRPKGPTGAPVRAVFDLIATS